MFTQQEYIHIRLIAEMNLIQERFFVKLSANY